MLASLGAYYLYLNKQKDGLLAEENGGYKLHRIDPSILETSVYGPGVYPYYLDSTSGTTGHPISKETYEAIQFLKNKETSKVLGWWDYELDINFKLLQTSQISRYINSISPICFCVFYSVPDPFSSAPLYQPGMAYLLAFLSSCTSISTKASTFSSDESTGA